MLINNLLSFLSLQGRTQEVEELPKNFTGNSRTISSAAPIWRFLRFRKASSTALVNISNPSIHAGIFITAN
jgi:hypothetical protein